MAWYLKKPDERLFGPVELPALQRWAADGRIAPDDFVSEDQVTWLPAPELQPLHMEWFILAENEDGSGEKVRNFGPIHILALRDMLFSGEVTPHTLIIHDHEAEEMEVATALASVLVDYTSKLEDGNARWAEEAETLTRTIEELNEQLDAQGEEGAPSASLQARLAETEQERDRLRQEAEALRIQTDQQMAELHSQLVCARDEAAELRRHAVQPEHPKPEPPSPQHTDDDVALRESYTDLSRRFDRLVDRLGEKSEEVERLIAAHSAAETEAQARIHELESQLRQKQGAFEEAEHRISKLEFEQLKMVKELRDLNDRYIALRQQSTSSATIHQAPTPPTPSPTAPAQPAGSSGWKPRVKLK